MIRSLLIIGLVALLGFTLFLPSRYPPAELIAVIRAEYSLQINAWGQEPALQSLGRALAWQAEAPRSVVPLPPVDPTQAVLTTALNKSLAGLANNQYTRGLDALLALAIFRFSTIIQWFPLAAIFALPVLIDGAIRRIVKSKEFRQHHPEAFIAALGAFTITVFGTAVICIWPVALPPLLLPLLPCLATVTIGIAIANYHRKD